MWEFFTDVRENRALTHHSCRDDFYNNQYLLYHTTVVKFLSNSPHAGIINEFQQ